MQPVVQPVVKPVWQPVGQPVVSCKRSFSSPHCGIDEKSTSPFCVVSFLLIYFHCAPYIHCVSKNVPPLTWSDCDNFGQWVRKMSETQTMSEPPQVLLPRDDALFSHLIYEYLLQHYLAKEETQKRARWCFVRATQSNCCSTLDFLSSEPCPPPSLSWTHRLQDLESHTAAWVWVKTMEEIKQRLVEFWQLCTVKNVIFMFTRFAR